MRRFSIAGIALLLGVSSAVVRAQGGTGLAEEMTGLVGAPLAGAGIRLSPRQADSAPSSGSRNEQGAAPQTMAAAPAQSYSVRKDTVIPIIFTETIDGDKAKVGDRFSAKVDGTRDLPEGTRLYGVVDKIEKKGSAVNATLRFTEIRLPGGSRERIDAVPVALNADFLKKQPDGRIVAQRNNRSKETKVLGGLLGGFVVGSIIGKQVEGAILGTIVGGIAAEADKGANSRIVVKEGQRYGAMFNRDATVNFTADPDRSATNVDRPGEGRDADPRGGTNSGDPYDRIRNGNTRDNGRDSAGSREGNAGPAPISDAISDGDFPTFGEGDPEIYRDQRPDAFVLQRGERTLRFREAGPKTSAVVNLVPLRETAEMLQVKLLPFEGVGPIYLESDQGLVRLELDSREIRRNGERTELRVAPRKSGDRIYVPLEVFSSLVQEKLQIVRSPDRG